MFSGGNWNNGVHAGCRAVNVNNCPWNRTVSIGARLACDDYRVKNPLDMRLYGVVYSD
jgi:hypothetical protein